MFGKMMDLTTKTTIDAIGFYIMSTVLLVGISTVLVHVLSMMGVVTGVGTFFDGGSLYSLIGTGFVLVLSSLILGEKKLTGDIFSIILVLISLWLSYTTNVLLGLIPVALLTTFKSH